MSPFSPFVHKPDFLPGMLEAGFRDWVTEGISSLGCFLFVFFQRRDLYII